MTMAATLGPMLGPAVDLLLTTLASMPEGSGMVAGTYTPVGGVARPETHAKVARREQPHGGYQRLGATVLLLQSEVTVEPTDGATFHADGATWIIRTALRQVATWRCEAWA